jgi:NTP pyrophosphatase (non-canonical NTP hydrolase)
MSDAAGDGLERGAAGLRAFQKHIEALYYEKDSERGWERTFVWFMEEVGELARALHRDDRENLAEEFADVAAWLVSLASLRGIDLGPAAAAKYPER